MRAVDLPIVADRFDLKHALLREVEAAAAALAMPDRAAAVHQCRVRLKRARALARLARTAAPDAAKTFNKRARAIMAGLGAARDLAALEGCARMTAQKTRDAGAKAGLLAAAEALARERAALEARTTDDPAQAVDRLKGMVARWAQIPPRAVERGAARLATRASKAWREARGARDDDMRHDWRKREKERLYAAELMGAAWPKNLPRRVRAGKRLGQALGLERDVLLLAARLRAEPTLAGTDCAAALKALERRRKRLARRSDRLGRNLHRSKD
jgi:CHAD domain-containing protein